MRSIFLLVFFVNCLFLKAQDSNVFQKKGFSIGLGIGAGSLRLNTNDTLKSTFSTTLPNLKIGFMINKRLALFALLPGANYKYQGKARGFEGFTVAAQYWPKQNWWILGGTGLTFDAPAFYTVKDPKTAAFYTGLPSFLVATGYELWHKGRFALDLQYRLFIGKSNLPGDGSRKGISNMLILGFNWY